MKYAYWLYQVKTLGNRKKIYLHNTYGQEEQIYHMKRGDLEKIKEPIPMENGETEWRPLLSEENIESMLNSKKSYNFDWEMEQLEKKNICFTSYGSIKYPEALRQIPDSPYGICYRGELPNEKKRTVGMIGARNCSEYGKYVAKEFAAALGAKGIQIVSGMARGIDGISQKACIEAGGKSYGVFGCGVDICYPKQNRELYELLRQNGGILSEYPLGTQPLAQLFPPRNRIISALSQAIIVIEAREKSGTLITVDMALEQGKEVYVVPGRITDSLSGGCNRLIKQGAGVITSLRELLQEWGMEETLSCVKKEKIPIGREEKIVYDCLDICPKSISQIYEDVQNRTGQDFELAQMLEILINLELKKIIVKTSGNYFAKNSNQGSIQ